jgi:hypothetical protein
MDSCPAAARAGRRAREPAEAPFTAPHRRFVTPAWLGASCRGEIGEDRAGRPGQRVEGQGCAGVGARHRQGGMNSLLRCNDHAKSAFAAPSWTTGSRSARETVREAGAGAASASRAEASAGTGPAGAKRPGSLPCSSGEGQARNEPGRGPRAGIRHPHHLPVHPRSSPQPPAWRHVCRRRSRSLRPIPHAPCRALQPGAVSRPRARAAGGGVAGGALACARGAGLSSRSAAF